MRGPTLTIAVPSIGRATLPDTLASIARQDLIPGDRILVVYDSFEDRAVVDIRALVASYGFDFQAVNAGYHFYGNPQLNHAIAQTTTEYFCALGDDDVYVDGAIARLRAALRPGRALLGQFYTPPYMIGVNDPRRLVLWEDQVLRVANLSGCCLVAPTPALVPVSAERRIEVDFDWITAIVARTGQRPIWLKDCLIIARPEMRHGQTVHRGVSSCRGCGVVGFLEDLDADRLCEGCAPSVLREFLEPETCRA